MNAKFPVLLACALSLAAYGTALNAAEPQADKPAAAATPAAARPAAARTATASKAAKKERRICKKIAPTGTRVARRTCMTAAQWETVEKASREATEKVQRDDKTNTTQGS